MKAVVLLSGGLDSTTVLYQAMHDGAEEILAVTYAYGSRHEAKEIQAAKDVIDRAYLHEDDIGWMEHQIITLPKIFSGGGSALMGDVDVPQEEYKDYDFDKEGESVTVVPFRNANLISMAITLAEVKGYSRVYAGMHASDHSTWAYPDCSPEFLGAMANASYTGTLGRVRLVFPFVWMTKAEVVTRGVLLNAPLHVTWSCYQGRYAHCGECPTCLERISAFVEAGWKDPVPYISGAAVMDGLEEVEEWSQQQ